ISLLGGHMVGDAAKGSLNATLRTAKDGFASSFLHGAANGGTNSFIAGVLESDQIDSDGLGMQLALGGLTGGVLSGAFHGFSNIARARAQMRRSSTSQPHCAPSPKSPSGIARSGSPEAQQEMPRSRTSSESPPDSPRSRTSSESLPDSLRSKT